MVFKNKISLRKVLGRPHTNFATFLWTSFLVLLQNHNFFFDISFSALILALQCFCSPFFSILTFGTRFLLFYFLAFFLAYSHHLWWYAGATLPPLEKKVIFKDGFPCDTCDLVFSDFESFDAHNCPNEALKTGEISLFSLWPDYSLYVDVAYARFQYLWESTRSTS